MLYLLMMMTWLERLNLPCMRGSNVAASFFNTHTHFAMFGDRSAWRGALRRRRLVVDHVITRCSPVAKSGVFAASTWRA